MNRSAPSKFLLLVFALTLGLCSCTPKKAEQLLQPAEAMGVVMADEAIEAAGSNRSVAIITHDSRWGPTSIVETKLRATLQSRGYTVTTAKAANLGDAMSMRAGLQPADFFEAMQNAAQAGAVVSLVGPPLMGPDAASQLQPNHPPILVVATDSLGDVPEPRINHAQLESLLDAKVIQLAIVNGTDDSGASSAGKNDSAHVLFAQNYRILRQPH